MNAKQLMAMIELFKLTTNYVYSNIHRLRGNRLDNAFGTEAKKGSKV